MIIGVECTAHTFGVGIVHNGKILANVRDMYRPAKGGIIPVDAANHHRDVAELLYTQALEQAKISDRDVEAIAISNAPGLAPCLRAGLEFARKKTRLLGVPIVPVHHGIAHLEIGRKFGATDPVLLYASGANTQVIAFVSGRYRVFGETLDMGIGNFIDNFARFIGVPFPGGPEVEKLALSGKYLELPYSIKGMDVSFSGMLTKLKQLYNEGMRKEDLCFSLQETAFAMIIEASERALAHTDKKELVLGGGVGCNARLREMCEVMCSERGAKFFCPSKDLLVDNGAMIAFLGELMYKSGIREKDCDFAPRDRVDDINVRWRKR